MNNTLHRTIMRRVYYAYFIRLITMPGVARGFVMVAALIGLTRFVSIRNVLVNLSHVEVGQVGTFFYNAVMHTHFMTLVLLGVIIYCLLSVRFKLHFEQPAEQFVRV